MAEVNPFQWIDTIKTDREAQQKEKEKSLERLHFTYAEFSQAELEEIIKLRKLLETIKTEIGLITPENIDASYETLFHVQNTIDDLSIWDSKFTTGVVGRFNKTDSVYYTTPSGISLRFKMSNVGKDISSVIQPFMESIIFTNQRIYYPEQMPAIGLQPEEYCSTEFYELQNQLFVGSSFTSKVKMYFKDKKLYYVEPPENLFHDHPGSPINKICFIKPANY